MKDFRDKGVKRTGLLLRKNSEDSFSVLFSQEKTPNTACTPLEASTKKEHKKLKQNIKGKR